MARISYEQAKQMNEQNRSNDGGVSFFSLKHDGDVAVVRFMHNSPDDFDVLLTHNVTVNGKFRKISCLRDDAHLPLEYCPLCANNTKLEQKFFIHLIQYVRDDTTGVMKAIPCIWERSLAYADKLANFIQEYGPLEDVLFTVKRRGLPGDVKTSYDINYASPMKYPAEAYAKPTTDLFENFNVLGTMVMNKTYDDLSNFVLTGQFPANNAESNNSINVNAGEMSYTPAEPAPNYAPAPQPATSVAPAPQPTMNAAPTPFNTTPMQGANNININTMQTRPIRRTY